jgi:RNA polymerase sigma-32 factor
MAKRKKTSKARKAEVLTPTHDGTQAVEDSSAPANKNDGELEILDPEEAEADEAAKDACGEADDPEICKETLPAPAAAADALQRYLWEIRRYPLLTREEEKELSQYFKRTGDPEAAAKLVTSNLRLVVKIAMDHQRYWMRNLLDLIQEGNMGLLQAVQKYDPFRGIKFSYYASFGLRRIY